MKTAELALALVGTYCGLNAAIDAGGALEAHHVVTMTSQSPDARVHDTVVNDSSEALHDAEKYALLGALAGVGIVLIRLRRPAEQCGAEE